MTLSDIKLGIVGHVSCAKLCEQSLALIRLSNALRAIYMKINVLQCLEGYLYRPGQFYSAGGSFQIPMAGFGVLEANLHSLGCI